MATSGATGIPPSRTASRRYCWVTTRANPVEFLLHALAGCVTTTTVLHAAARGIRIESIATELSGEIALQGLLGLDDTVAPGYTQIQLAMNSKADCSEEELDALLNYAQQHSPVCNTVCRPVPVVINRITSTARGGTQH